MTNLAVFASGNGTNFETIVNSCNDKTIDGQVVLLVCDNPDAYCLTRASSLNVPVFVIEPKKFKSKADYEQLILTELKKYKVQLICLAGYMRIVGSTLLDEYPNLILNIHPSLLPRFAGSPHAIEDAFYAREQTTGVTIHYVTSELDLGKPVAQQPIATAGLTLAELTQKLHEIEYKIYPRAISIVLQDKKLNNN